MPTTIKQISAHKRPFPTSLASLAGHSETLFRNPAGYAIAWLFASPWRVSGFLIILCSSYIQSIQADSCMNTLRHILPKNPIIVEAGACDGSDTQTFAHAWPQAEIYAFEPVPELYTQLTEKIHNTPNVVPFNCALSTYNGIADFFICTNNNGASSLLEPTTLINHLHFNKPIKVPCTTLKTWANTHAVDAIDLLWLDCEGHELAILKAAGDLIDHTLAIHIEVNFKTFRKSTALFDTLKTWLENHNFTEVWRSTYDTSWQANVLFLSKKHVN